MKPKVFFIRKKQNKTKFFEKKNPKWPTQKNKTFKPPVYYRFKNQNQMLYECVFEKKKVKKCNSAKE